jgi:MFS family permease
MVLSTVVLTVTAAASGERAFLAWGWRVPFLLSILLLGIGLFIRLKVEETPVFAAAERSARVPLFDVLRNHPRNLLLAVGVGLAAFVAQGTLTTFLIAYGVEVGYSRQTVLSGLTLSSVLAVAGIIGYSALSDRLGRRPVVLAGAVAMAAFSFLLFPLVDSGNVVLLVVTLVLGQAVIQPAMYGPLAALCTELFSTRSRYTGASLGYQLSGLGAGLAPVLFAAILAGGGSTMTISLIISGFCLLTVVCVVLLAETSGNSLTETAPAPADAAATATATRTR